MKKPVDVFSDEDKRDIRDCARGLAGAREKAVSLHRTYLRTHGVRRGDPYFDFMSEVDNPCPDLLLRSRYREAVIKLSPQGSAGTTASSPDDSVLSQRPLE